MTELVRHRIEDLLTGLHEIDANIRHEQIPKRVILLMGQTKAGKTTLYYYLLGKKLVWEKNELEVWQMRPETRYFIALIGSGYDSTTVYPNIPSELTENGTMVIDMPGFDDSRFHFRLLGVYIILQILKLTQEAHICHVIPEERCHSDALMTELEKSTQVFNKEFLHSNACLSFVLTKVQNQLIASQFSSQIDDLIESSLVSHIEEELKEFKNKHIYEFHNKNPVVEEGIVLRQRIQNENSFFEVNHDPKRILSSVYCLDIIGRSNLEEFSDYLKLVIEDIIAITQILIALYADIVKLEFHEIIAVSLGHDPSNYLQEMKASLSLNGSKLTICEFSQTKLKIKPRASWLKEHVTALLKCFEKAEALSEGERLPIVLLHFSKTVSLLRKSQTLLDESYLVRVENFLKEIGSLISIIAQIKLSQIQEKFKQLTESHNILSIIQTHQSFWKVHQMAFLNAKQLLPFSNLPQIVEIIGNFNDLGFEEVIRKVPKYSEARKKKEIKEIITKSHTKIGKSGMSHHSEDISQLEHSEQTDKFLKKMPITRVSLVELKGQVDILSQKEKAWLLRKILSKMSEIFYWYSFFQEAIMFKMAVADEPGLSCLVEEGMASAEISCEFTQTILIPYYSHINMNLQALQACFNYIMGLCVTPEQLVAAEQQRLELLGELSLHAEECLLLVERYRPLELYYINPILQGFEYYLQQIEKREVQFNRSPIAHLKGFINKRMKQ